MIPGKSLHRRSASDPGAVDDICRDLSALLTHHRLESHLFGVELVARELMNNAVFHGNARDSTKQFDFFMTIGRRWIRIRISDEGEGYDWRRIRRTPPDVGATSGRGLSIARLYACKVRFADNGRCIEALFDRMVTEQEQ